ncbi:hypothetical protein SAMN02745218_01568 [Desulfofundulus australicus DSM 11792]|uniref:Uncharacterized protein n=1 Tax=Desulfofundulus australicus DSM 11792 TaxID=1121425 RepID=A0A1M4ZBC4_9FIRM|nr:hypothetical protein [Desulfofundulus australicus]SHF15285.1 hypothetical protein SAMN02745218_01568 [Desulfofundulus australicus DSM 11792]
MELELVEQFRKLVLDKELPGTDVVLFGVTCPYCGKNDRIRPLEPPEELSEELGQQEMALYARVWRELHPDNSLAVCRFCRNILQVQAGARRAEPLGEW